MYYQHEAQAALSEGFPVHRVWRWVHIHQECSVYRKSGGWVLAQDLHSVYSTEWEGWELSWSISLVPSLRPSGTGDRGTWLLSQSCFRSMCSGARMPGTHQHQGLLLTAPEPVFNDSYLELGAGKFMNFQYRDRSKPNFCLGLNDSNIESLSGVLESAGQTVNQDRCGLPPASQEPQ